MTVRGFAVACMLIALGAGASAPAAAQEAFEPARLPDGKPDLQGVWDFKTLTPLQRPEEQESAVLSDEEAAEVEAQSAARSAELNAPTERTGDLLPVGGNVGGYNHYWVDQGASVVDDQRTSLIVDPPEGRVPPLQPGFELIELSLGEDRPGTRPVRVRAAGIGADSYEDRGLAERCLLGFNSGPPIVPAGYNQNLQIFQTPDHVVILHEMVHDPGSCRSTAAIICPLPSASGWATRAATGTATRWSSSRRTSATRWPASIRRWRRQSARARRCT